VPRSFLRRLSSDIIAPGSFGSDQTWLILAKVLNLRQDVPDIHFPLTSRLASLFLTIKKPLTT
jgi:hypothetical protein